MIMPLNHFTDFYLKLYWLSTSLPNHYDHDYASPHCSFDFLEMPKI